MKNQIDDVTCFSVVVATISLKHSAEALVDGVRFIYFMQLSRMKEMRKKRSEMHDAPEIIRRNEAFEHLVFSAFFVIIQRHNTGFQMQAIHLTQVF